MKESETLHKQITQKKKVELMNDEELLQQALALSRKDSDRRKTEQELEEEDLQRAIRESEELEKEKKQAK